MNGPSEIARLSGGAIPDWLAVTSATASEALAALVAGQDLSVRWSGLPAAQARLRRAILVTMAAGRRAPTISELAAAVGGTVEATRGTLDALAARDVVVVSPDGGAVVGAYPFSARDTGHAVKIGDIRVNAMCAVDALGVGAMLGRGVAVRSSCPRCAAPINVITGRRGRVVALVQPFDSVLWLDVGYGGDCAADSLCRRIALFCSDNHLAAWRDDRRPQPTGYRLTVPEALEVAVALFGPLLSGG